MSSPDIFISYNREDAAIAQLYADAFTDAGLVVWWDATLRSGEDYDAVTEQALRTAKSVVVLWSPRSVNSRWVRAEATIADRGKRLMPVMIESCDRPVMFELKQTADLSNWRGDRDDKAWLSLVADVQRKIGQAPDAAARETPEKAAPAKSASVEDDRSAVAVLPFGCRAGDDELALQAEDLTEDVTRELAYNRYFRVIAAGTMAAWRGKAIDHKNLGQRLEARYLVEGKLQRSGGNNRLTVQLVDGGSGNVLWSTRVSADSSDAEFSADALGAAVAAQVADQIVQRVQARAMSRQPPFSAWDHILRSTAFLRRASEDGARLAVEEARLAVAAGPEIGLAHATLASTLAAVLESQGLAPDQDQIHEIQTRTRQAMRLDGNNPSVLMALAGAYKGLGEYEVCLRLARRTVELWPSSPQSYLILGNSYRMLGRTAEAIDAYRKQDRLSPFDNSRNVALTCLGECLLLQGQPEEAEAALDRALMLDPEYPVALEWKAIVADCLGKDRAALDVMRQIRSAEASVPLDQHAWQIERNAHLRDLAAGHVATLRRLWLAIDGTAATPMDLPEPLEAVLEVAEEPNPDPVAEAAHPAAALSIMETAAILLEPTGAASAAIPEVVPEVAVAVASSVGDAPAPAGESTAGTIAIPLKATKPKAAPRSRGRNQEGDKSALPLARNSGSKPNDAYLFNDPVQPATRDDRSGPTAIAGAVQDGAGRRFTLSRGAAFAAAIVMAGIGGFVWLGGGKDDNAGGSAAAVPIAAIADPGLLLQNEAAVAGQPLAVALTTVITASRNARRPQAELAVLEAGQQRLAGLLAQSASQPANAALAAQINALAADLARQQGAALSVDADRWFKSQQQEAGAARRGLLPEGAAMVDRALNKARGAKADVATLVAVSGRAPEAMKSLEAARAAVAAYNKLSALSVAPAIASARSAEAEVGKVKERLARSRVDIETARTEVGRLSGQVAGLAAIEKPGLFASSAKRQSHKLRKDNAARARALAAEADRLAAQSGAASELGDLKSSLSRLQSLKSQTAELLAASNAALKSAAEPESKATTPAKK